MLSMKKVAKLKEPVIFIDFDNTITTIDVLDDMLMKFSRNDNWMKLEERWQNGEIGSRECLKGQVEGIGLTIEALDDYLATIEIDPSFKDLIKLLKSRNVKMFILSDNFEYILDRVLKNNGISDLKIYANRLEIIGDRLIPTFPLTNEDCGGCAHCKKTTLLGNVGVNSTAIYIGDGRSDVCATQSADMIFAKDYLKDYCKAKKLTHVPFKGLKDVCEYFQRSLA